MQGSKRRCAGTRSAREGPPSRCRAAVKRYGRQKKRRKLSRAGRFVVLAVVLLALICICSVAAWAALPIGSVAIDGKVPYTRAQILQVCGISSGDRLFGVDKQKTARLLETNLPYIADVSVSCNLPGTLVLHLQKAVPVAAVAKTGGFAILDGKGKVLEAAANLQAYPNLPVVTGPDAGSAVPGQYLKAGAKAKLASAASLLQAVKTAGITQVTAVDVHDVYQITFVYQNRITVLVGTMADLDDKLKFGAYMITKQLLATDKGTLDVSQSAQSNQAIFSPSN